MGLNEGVLQKGRFCMVDIITLVLAVCLACVPITMSILLIYHQIRAKRAEMEETKQLKELHDA